MTDSDQDLDLAVEVRNLLEKLRVRDGEVTALQAQVTAVTTQLHETSNELECRMTFVTDAMTQIETLEDQVAEANRSILTREMQLQEGQQREKALETVLLGKEKQAEHWESEFHRIDSELVAHKVAEKELKQKLQTKIDDRNAWKAKAQANMTTIDELKLQNTTARKKGREIIAALRQQVKATQESWKARVAKRELAINLLRRQCQDLQGEVKRVERKRTLEQDAREQDRVALNDQEADKQELIVVLREKVEKLTAAVEKANVKEPLFRKEISRLREELLMSESHRETDHRRQEQLVEGKEREIAFLWQKYVEVLSLTEKNSQD